MGFWSELMSRRPKRRSPVAKHMNTFNKPATHVDKKKQSSKGKDRMTLLEEYADELESLKNEGKV